MGDRRLFCRRIARRFGSGSRTYPRFTLIATTKVEKVSLKSGPNNDPADLDIAQATYAAMKRLICARSLIFAFPLAGVVAVKAPFLGLEVALGGICGNLNMFLMMHGNEKLVDGRRSKGIYVVSSLLRILVFGAVPVFSFVNGPWWAMGLYFAGFFSPLLLYALELNRVYRREA